MLLIGEILDPKKDFDLKECHEIFNGVYREYKDHIQYILRCKNEKDGKAHSEVKIIDNKNVYTYDALESAAFLKWDCCNGKFPFHEFHGAEEPRLFYYKNEAYLYYSMNNPLAKDPIRGIEYIKYEDAMKNKQTATFLQPNIFGKTNEVEKNWIFFSNQTDILVYYSMNPWILGEVNQEKKTFEAKISRNYDCVDPKMSVHFSSNALPVNVDGREELLYFVNYRPHPGQMEYVPGFAFMSATAPYELLRVSNDHLESSLKPQKLVYYNSITVKGNLFFI
eukprot:NODE_16_length_49026_cov_1.035992.p14 type:complete len:279 gc:universal NODE_16_length_49026_cov_1.035992:17906-18742(+)